MTSPWKWLCENTSKPVFAAVIFALGVIVWGGFNTAMEATNTMGFCVSCHEMRDNVYAEYQQTKHFENHAGVRAICSDCHVPKEWGHKVVRKIRATNELFHWLAGTIDTREKFEAKRLTLARSVWREMEANGSRECKNCHSYESMHWKSQSMDAMMIMQTAEQRGLSCIECHKGVAHQLPDFPKYYAGLKNDLQAHLDQDSLDGVRVTTTSFKRLLAAPTKDANKLVDVMPLTDFEILDREGDWLKVRLNAWDKDASAELYKTAGQDMELAFLSAQGLTQAKHAGSVASNQAQWRKTSIVGWTQRTDLISDRGMVEGYVEELWRTECNICHNLPRHNRYKAGDWVKLIDAMREKSTLPYAEMTMILKFLQTRAADMPG